MHEFFVKLRDLRGKRLIADNVYCSWSDVALSDKAKNKMMTSHEHNWAGNITYKAANIHRPKTLTQLRDVVTRSQKLRALGTRHSFNDITECAGDWVSLENLEPTFAIDRARNTVTVNGNITYSQLSQQLHHEGFALHNLASLPHISVAGACATATHGSGDANGNLATAVAALEIMTATGDLVTFSRATQGEKFAGAVVALGGLGLVTKVTLNMEPAFAMQQEVYEYLPVAQLEENFDAITASAYSVSLFTDWQHDTVNQVWLKRRLADATPLALAPTFFGAALAPTHRHPVTGRPPAPFTLQMGLPGPWHERLPHYRSDHVFVDVDEMQSEYFVPRHHAVAAMRAMAQLSEPLARVLGISEVRTIAADALWLSPCYEQACVGLHFSWRGDLPAVQKVLPVLEASLAPFEARPHWGKLFAMPPAQVQSFYPRLPEFRDLLHTYDPQGKFRNAFLNRYI